MNGNPTAEQKRFHEWARDYGCIIDNSENPAIHHIKGSKMKLKGVDKAGEWYVIPLSYHWHQDGSHSAALHVNKNEFERVTVTEKTHWILLMSDYYLEHGCFPMSDEEYQIIVERA